MPVTVVAVGCRAAVARAVFDVVAVGGVVSMGWLIAARTERFRGPDETATSACGADGVALQEIREMRKRSSQQALIRGIAARLAYHNLRVRWSGSRATFTPAPLSPFSLECCLNPAASEQSLTPQNG